MGCLPTNGIQNRASSIGSNQFLCLCENLCYIDSNPYNLCRTMNTTPQTPISDCNSVGFLEPDMANLLHMTNDVLSKIKLQTKETYL